MSHIFIVGYDVNDSAERAVAFAVAQAKAAGTELSVVHILEWPLYTFLTPEELEERQMRRQQELKRAEKTVTPIVERVKTQGVNASAVIRYGHVVELLCEIAKEVGAVCGGRSA